MRPCWLPDVMCVLAGGILALFGIVILMLCLFPMPITDTAGQLLNLMVGGLIASLTAIIQYYFGSSKGSSTKDETIQKLAEK